MLEKICSPLIEFDYTGHLNLSLVMEMEKKNSRFVYVWSKDNHIDTIEDEDKLHLVIKAKSTQEIVGYIIIGGMKSKDKSLELERIVVDKKGKGYGREAIKLIKKLCFDILSYHRLWLDVFDDNEAAIKLYFNEGFVKEGLLRECKKYPEGYRSMLIMSILEHEYYNQNNQE
ncbi:GNAT family protein [Proteinivorax hydrogeniformans]|uniref:GNAT family protein n=1 Tax=Proteinivorax hydrogeniformans TaxID=1826727 RepID=A0AAU8HS81_9FIRM